MALPLWSGVRLRRTAGYRDVRGSTCREGGGTNPEQLFAVGYAALGNIDVRLTVNGRDIG